MEIAKVTSKGQITVPKEVRDDLALEPGSKVLFVKQGNNWQVLSTKQSLSSPETDQERSDRIKERFLAEMSAEYDLDYPVETDQSKPINELIDEIRAGFAGVAEENGWETEQDVADYINSLRNGKKR